MSIIFSLPLVIWNLLKGNVHFGFIILFLTWLYTFVSHCFFKTMIHPGISDELGPSLSFTLARPEVQILIAWAILILNEEDKKTFYAEDSIRMSFNV